MEWRVFQPMNEIIQNFFPLIMVGFLFLIYYFLLLRPAKKRDKALKEMRGSLEVGNKIISIGGIMGRVVSVKDDYVVIETGADKTKLQVTKWAISQRETPNS